MAEESEDFLLTTYILYLLLPNNMSLVQDLHCIGGGREGKVGGEIKSGEGSLYMYTYVHICNRVTLMHLC